MPLPLLLSVLVGVVTGLLVTASLAPEALPAALWRLLAALVGFGLLGSAAYTLVRRLQAGELVLRDVADPGAGSPPSPAGRRQGLVASIARLWEMLVWRVDAWLGGTAAPAAQMPSTDDPPPPPGARMRSPEERRPLEPAELQTIVRLPQRIPCMMRLPARGERTPGRELGRLARAVARVRELGPGRTAGALLVDVDPMVLVTAGARSRLQALVGDPAPLGCTLVLVLEPPAGEGPEALPVDLLTDLLAPGRIELGLKVEDAAGLAAERIRRLGFSFLLLPAAPLRAKSPDDPVDPALVALFEDCRRLGIAVVVEGVDGERILLDVLDYPVDLACGALFAVPETAMEEGGRRVA